MKGINRVLQVFFITAEGPEILSYLDALVGSQVDINLGAGAQLRIKILGQNDAASKTATGWKIAIKDMRLLRVNSLFIHVWNEEVARIHRVATKFHPRNGHFAAGVHDADVGLFRIGLPRLLH